MLSVSTKGMINRIQTTESLVRHRDSFDGALIDTNTAIRAESSINNSLIVTLDSLGWTTIDTGFAGCASFRVNLCWHLSTFLLLTKLQKN